MISLKLKNKLRINYKKSDSNITSFCFGLEAGAFSEDENEIGIAHAVEHYLYKGTKNYSEEQINEKMSEIFGFTNAMTNYPYVIYYGSCLKEDTEEGIKVFSDILMNPLFSEEGFSQEIKVICEELKEWKDDAYQYCEDELYFNSYRNHRLKYPIIGNEAFINNITIEKMKKFYDKNYVPGNCVLTIITNLNLEETRTIIEKHLSSWKANSDYCPLIKTQDQVSKASVYKQKKVGLTGAKIQYLFHIEGLTLKEERILRIFNERFGQAVDSILYEEIRTKRGLAYDISSLVKFEKGIKNLIIKAGTGKENITKVIEIINKCICDVKEGKYFFSQEQIEKTKKSLELKNAINNEMSIRLTIRINISEIMFNSTRGITKIFNDENITGEDIIEVTQKVLENPSIQIIEPM
ncbi:M16 family metallopeptidase [Clostridium grantii]|uniref:Predicted Zn-dependent peptidase n=1 Tax=Clostridium grantii DSM 8605 TaxID=1121316 RepID=A0A1M5QNW3_9CLOT|nr:pitrilysin family protein [Clostridium grantii]SHH15807.1 Predicted Zn-dependent peptidase [Clostridium grantii DSM 8605]